MKTNKKSSPDIVTPTPPQVMHPIRKSDSEKKQKAPVQKEKSAGEKQLAPNEEL